jgi:hypothetical protein
MEAATPSCQVPLLVCTMLVLLMLGCVLEDVFQGDDICLLWVDCSCLQ